MGNEEREGYALPDEAYDILKWVGLALCPALATLIGAVGPAWGMPHVDAVVLTINAIGTFVGAIIGVSQLSATGSDPDADATGNLGRHMRG